LAKLIRHPLQCLPEQRRTHARRIPMPSRTANSPTSSTKSAQSGPSNAPYIQANQLGRRPELQRLIE
jgi:hypothetical protein